jgi:two-component sensor histidine kinase
VSLVKWGNERWHSVWRNGLYPRSAASLTFALACVGIATLVRMGLGLISPDSAVFAPYYSATLLAALVGGAMAGGIAALLGGIIACWLFVPHEWSLAPFVVEQLVSLFLFVASSVVIICAAQSYRTLLQRVREAESKRQLLNYELAHRIKNMLANAQAIINQTLRDQPNILNKLSARIAALEATNDLLVDSEWRGASVRDIITGEFSPYDPTRFQLIGGDVECPPSIAIMLALIVHELTTNAVKYGALSNPDGRISVCWKKTSNRLDVEWVENGGTQLKTRLNEGFGSKLLRACLKRVDGLVDMQIKPTGLQLKLSMNLPKSLETRSVGIASEQSRSGCNTSVSGLAAKIH